MQVYVIISETVQAMPITFSVKIVELKVYKLCSHYDGLALHSRSQLRVKIDNVLTCTIYVFIYFIYSPQWGTAD